jgi:hypothetical protein
MFALNNTGGARLVHRTQIGDLTVARQDAGLWSWTSPRRSLQEFVMRPITARRIGRCLATTERDDPGFHGIELRWRKSRTLVRPVAEWLLATFAARTPPVGFPSLDLDLVGTLLGNNRQ